MSRPSPSSSRSATARPRRLVTVLLTAAAASVALLGVGMPAASAHDRLVGSAPAADAAVPTAPEAVTLEFSGSIQSLGTQVVVNGPDGAPASEGAVRIDGSTVTQPLAADVQAGAHTVLWKATSSDGHALSGEFSFTVAESAAPSTAPSSTPPAPTTEAAAASPSSTTDVREVAAQESATPSPPYGWVAAGAAALLLAAGGLFLLRRRRT